jgi:CBS domain-containing protein
MDVENKNYIGRLATWDIANLVVNNPNLSLKSKISDIWSSTVGVTSEDEKALKYGPGGLESIYTFSIDSPIELLFKTFTQGIHRVLVTHWKEGRENVLRNYSQSDLIRSLLWNEDLLVPEVRNKTMNELKIITRPAITVRLSDKVADILKIMNENKINAVAVSEDESNTIKTTFSRSDLRRLDDGLIQQLHDISINDYLLNHNPKLRPSITFKANNTLESALKKMASKRVHQLWEVDENRMVIGVVSMTDILRTLSEDSHVQ